MDLEQLLREAVGPEGPRRRTRRRGSLVPHNLTHAQSGPVVVHPDNGHLEFSNPWRFSGVVVQVYDDGAVRAEFQMTRTGEAREIINPLPRPPRPPLPQVEEPEVEEEDMEEEGEE